MKVLTFYLAFLIIIMTFIPYMLSSCINDEKELLSTSEIKMYDNRTKEILNIGLEDYIVGVVCAEMPASFDDEALKAQAVAARTYTLRKTSGNTHENGADVCNDFSHCQAFVNENEAKSKWQVDFKKNYNKIKNAVYSTSGECLTYNDEYAMTVFHSCSNGLTEKASDVWSSDVPYLVNVESTGDEIKKDYITKNEFKYDEFIQKLEDYLNKSIDKSLPPIGDISYTSGNNVASITLYGNNIKGTDIRGIFGLKSSAFSLEYENDSFIFTVTGNGHGVGMSQYGAESMARDGASYREILAHYYPGTIIYNLNK